MGGDVAATAGCYNSMCSNVGCHQRLQLSVNVQQWSCLCCLLWWALFTTHNGSTAPLAAQSLYSEFQMLVSPLLNGHSLECIQFKSSVTFLGPGRFCT
jgi:hypothetical protein